MNANELADKLQTIRKSIWYDIDHVVAKFVDETTNEAATMLRQQQAENETIKEANKNLMELVTMLREEVDKLRKAQEK